LNNSRDILDLSCGFALHCISGHLSKLVVTNAYQKPNYNTTRYNLAICMTQIILANFSSEYLVRDSTFFIHYRTLFLIFTTT